MLDKASEMRSEQKQLVDLTEKLRNGVFGMVPAMGKGGASKPAT
jgi:hypothetical protein